MSNGVRRGAHRAVAVTVLAGLCVSGWTPTAWAGGAILEFRSRGAAVGSPIVARSVFDPYIRNLPKPADGPFYGYLLPAGPPWRWIDLPRIPRGAVPLGPIRIRSVKSSDARWDHVARLRFIVPEVPTGVYSLHFCNDPCTESSVGELAGGGFVGIGATSSEGALAVRLWLQEFRLDSARQAARRTREREAGVREVLDTRSELLDQASEEAEGLRRVIERVDERADGAIAANAAAQRSADVYKWLSLALGMALLVTTLAALRTSRRAKANDSGLISMLASAGLEAVAISARRPRTARELDESELANAGRGSSGA